MNKSQHSIQSHATWSAINGEHYKKISSHALSLHSTEIEWRVNLKNWARNKKCLESWARHQKWRVQQGCKSYLNHFTTVATFLLVKCYKWHRKLWKGASVHGGCTSRNALCTGVGTHTSIKISNWSPKLTPTSLKAAYKSQFNHHMAIDIINVMIGYIADISPRIWYTPPTSV